MNDYYNRAKSLKTKKNKNFVKEDVGIISIDDNY